MHETFHNNYLDEILANYDKSIILNEDPFYIADLGCSGGKNSLLTLIKIISITFYITTFF